MGTIQQAAGGGGGGAVILRLNGLSGTSISAALGAKTVTGTIGTDGVFQTKLPELGLWKVTATSGSYSFTQDVKVYRYGITEGWAFTSKPFADCTPAEIQTIARAGMASRYWQIGDKHQVVLSTGETIHMEIADFNHDVAPSGDKLPLTLIMEDCFNTLRQMNSTRTTSGGWQNCSLRTGVLPGIKASFPAEWQAIMAVAAKQTSGGSSAIVTTNDYIWLLSEIEAFGFNTHSYAGEGSVYPIFTDDTSRIANVNNVALGWWERSPNSNGISFCRVSSNGSASRGEADGNAGIRLGFCVG